MPYFTIKKKTCQEEISKKGLTKNSELQNYKNRVDVATRFSEAYYTGPAGMMPAGMGTPGKEKRTTDPVRPKTAPGPSPPTGVRPRYNRN